MYIVSFLVVALPVKKKFCTSVVFRVDAGLETHKLNS
jgi:hypothetical protein